MSLIYRLVPSMWFFFPLAFCMDHMEALAKAFPAGVGWPIGSTLEVYIEAIDPPNMINNRQSRIAEGIMRWEDELGPRLKFNIHFGPPPNPPPQNLVHFKWRRPGTIVKGRRITETNAVTGITVDNIRKPTRIVRADGFISSAARPSLAMANLGMHEFTHAIGLADDNRGKVTDTFIDSFNATQFNAQDRREIATLYGRKPAQQQVNLNLSGPATSASVILPRGRVELLDFSGGEFDYQISFEGDATEIVDVMTFFVHPRLVDRVVPPTGWIYLDPLEVAALGPDAPYFDGYMEDSFTNPAPWERLPYITMQSTGAEFDLSLTNPVLNVSIIAPSAKTGLINVFAGNTHQTVLGVVPEPSGLGLLVVCCVLCLCRSTQRINFN